jgi:HK97 family phage prohead protease
VIRAQFAEPASVEQREEQPVMRGSLGNFEEWATIDSRVEGQFVERILPGAFKRTIEHNRARLRVIYDHGQDPRFGRHPLGPLLDIREGERGVEYEVGLLDTSYNRDLIPGLRAGMYGSSYNFRTVKMERVMRPPVSDHNPNGWEERSIRELEMVELGPTPFPVYASTYAGLRSMTDEFRSRQLGIDPEQLPNLHPALPEDGPAPASVESTRGDGAPVQPEIRRFRSREEYLQWLLKT